MKKKSINGFVLDETKNLLTNPNTGETKSIEPRLTRILVMLLNAKGEVVQRSSLIQKIWGNYNSGEQLLTHSIAMLRKEVGKEAIKTIPKKGYLIEEVTRPQKTTNFNFKAYYWLILLIFLFLARMVIFPHH